MKHLQTLSVINARRMCYLAVQNLVGAAGLPGDRDISTSLLSLYFPSCEFQREIITLDRRISLAHAS
jgi:hypothetical protein